MGRGAKSGDDMFSVRFRRVWWMAILVATTLVVFQCLQPNWAGSADEWFYQQYSVFLVWLVLLLMPLFSEISLFGLSVKRELRALRREVKRQATSNRLYWLGNDLASLRFQALIVRPYDENKRLVTWQGHQALDHARACRLPESLVDRLDSELKEYLANVGEEQARRFAERILELQNDVAGHFLTVESIDEEAA